MKHFFPLINNLDRLSWISKASKLGNLLEGCQKLNMETNNTSVHISIT